MKSSEELNSALCDYAQKLIRYKARQLVRGGAFPPHEEDDLRQELTLRLLKRDKGFDPTRASYNTFAARVISTQAATLVRQRFGPKHSLLRDMVSSDVPAAHASDGSTLGQHFSEADFARRTGTADFDPADHAERMEELYAGLCELEPELCDLCREFIAVATDPAKLRLLMKREGFRSLMQTIRRTLEANDRSIY